MVGGWTLECSVTYINYGYVYIFIYSYLYIQTNTFTSVCRGKEIKKKKKSKDYTIFQSENPSHVLHLLTSFLYTFFEIL